MEGKNSESDPSVGTSPKSVLDKVDTQYGPFPTSIPKANCKLEKIIEIPAPKEEENIDDDGVIICQRKNFISCTEHNVSKPEEDWIDLDIIQALKVPSEETVTLQSKKLSGTYLSTNSIHCLYIW